jgi:hypothetical protein
MVGTGFKGYVGRGACNRVSTLLRVTQGHDFSMGSTSVLGVALAEDNLMGGRYYTSNMGVWRRQTDCF